MADFLDPIAHAVTLIQGGGRAQAVAVLDRFLTGEPAHHQAMFVRAEALRLSGRNAEAERCLERLLGLVTVANGEIHYRLGLIRLAEGRIASAIDSLAAAARKLPDSHDPWLNLGTALSLQPGRETEAEEALKQAAINAPADTEALLRLADLLTRQGKEEETLAALKEAVDRAPDRVELVSAILSRHLDRDGPEAALAYLYRMVGRFPDDAQWQYTLGWQLRSLNRYAEAELPCRRSVILRPDMADYVAGLGAALYNLGGPFERQQAAFRQATRLDPDSVTAMTGLARVHLGNGDFPTARAIVEEFDDRTAYPRGARRSVVIPVLNYSPGSPYNIRTLLEDLASFDGEVICIFNGEETFDDLRNHPRIDKFSFNKYNAGVSRGWNMGINQAEGESIHILNADLKISVEMLYRLEYWLHSLPDALCVGVTAHWIDPVTLREVSSIGSQGLAGPMETDMVSGQLFTLHSRRLHDAGISFDPRLSPYFGEETDLFIKARASNLKIYAVPETDYIHGGGISVRDRPIQFFGRPVHRMHCMIDNDILLRTKAERMLGGG
jgi:tetratricopeptide (TPR) repeat protein